MNTKKPTLDSDKKQFWLLDDDGIKYILAEKRKYNLIRFIIDDKICILNREETEALAHWLLQISVKK